jgi:hypothetical protein
MNSTAVVSIRNGGSAVLAKNMGGAGATTTLTNKIDRTANNKTIEPWGTDNKEPHHLIEAAESNPVLMSTLSFIVRALYNGGIEYGSNITENGKKRFIPAEIPEIDDLLECSNASRQAMTGLQSLKMVGNTFPEIILSKNRKKLVRVGFLDASECRWGRSSERGIITNCHVSANWKHTNGIFKEEYTTRVPVLDNTHNELEALRNGKHYKYILQGGNMPMLGYKYYSQPLWNSLRVSEWLDYANQIPKFKASYLKNATHIKYLVHIPESWWVWSKPDFDELSTEERQAYIDSVHDDFESFLQGVENAGKSIIMTFRDDPDMLGAHGYSQWKIEPIDKKVMDNILGEDLLDITQIIYQAVGVHATLLGGAPGASNLGAGSGSDQREAYNIFMALSSFDQEVIMRPFNLALKYNGHKGITCRFNSRLLAPLQEVTPSERKEQGAN